MVVQQGIIINYWLCFCNFKYYINPFTPSFPIPTYKFNQRHKTQSTHTSTGTKVNSFSLDTFSFTVSSSQEWWGICTPSSKCLHTLSTLYSGLIASLIPFGPTTISLRNRLSNFLMIIQNVINRTCTLDIFDELSSHTGESGAASIQLISRIPKSNISKIEINLLWNRFRFRVLGMGV